MVKPKLTLVDNTNRVYFQKRASTYPEASPRQLSLFPEDERNRMVLIAMSDLNKLEFREILEDSNPVAIVDARKYPDFFGFYRSTQFALQSFEQLSIQYVHAPLHFSENGKAEDLWEVRQSATIALQKVRSQLDLFGNTCLMLTSSAFSRAHSERLLLSLSVFSRDWRLDVV